MLENWSIFVFHFEFIFFNFKKFKKLTEKIWNFIYYELSKGLVIVRLVFPKNYAELLFGTYSKPVGLYYHLLIKALIMIKGSNHD